MGATEANCVTNQAILHPIMERMRTLKSLDLPSLDDLKAELMSVLKTRMEQQQDQPKHYNKLRAVMKLSGEQMECNAHLDSKAIKRLLSFAGYRFKKIDQARETRLDYFSVYSFFSGPC